MSKKIDPEEKAFRRVEKAVSKRDKKELERMIKGIGDDKSGGILDVFISKKSKKYDWL